MSREITNSVALITGSARGIGKSIALRLAQDGHDIALNDIAANAGQLEATAEELRATGRKVSTVIADVSVSDDVTAMIEKVAADQGQLNVMIANAGIAKVTALLDMGVDEWDQVMEIGRAHV